MYVIIIIMKRYLILILSFYYTLQADITSAVVHSSISTYYEDKTFKKSVQKTDSVVYGIGADIHHEDSQYKFTYEHSNTNTKQPPLPKDLKVDKIFLRFSHDVNSKFKLNFNYIGINDNLAETDGGKTYGLGFTYALNEKSNINVTQYFTNYNYFNVYQSDLKFVYKLKINEVKLNLKSITKYININKKNLSSFTKNASSDYLTTGILFHAHYNSYHLGGGAYYGNRVFAVMSDGFKIQHHSMEINRTYSIGIGKTISNFILRFQYIYQKAEELPMQNRNVEIKNMRLVLNYKF